MLSTAADQTATAPRTRSQATLGRGRKLSTTDPLDNPAQLPIRGQLPVDQPILQEVILQRQQPLKSGPSLSIERLEANSQKTLKEKIQLLGTTAAAPAQAPTRCRRRSGIGTLQAHVSRSAISRLISAIALPGFSPFGHVAVQFMMVWQR